MAWIETVDRAAAQGRLAQLYNEVGQRRGKVANIMRVHSLMPETMKAHADFYMSVVFSASGLSREERELLAVVVSAANRCDYCVEHHAEALNHYWQDPDRLEKLKSDYRTAGLSKRSLAMATYGNKLARTPAEISERDVADLR
ncbi:MAG: peroxidase-related enzyme, partial [candidate division WOR-3 bacterium]